VEVFNRNRSSMGSTDNVPRRFGQRVLKRTIRP
jgi:hypothetical protein